MAADLTGPGARRLPPVLVLAFVTVLATAACGSSPTASSEPAGPTAGRATPTDSPAPETSVTPAASSDNERSETGSPAPETSVTPAASSDNEHSEAGAPGTEAAPAASSDNEHSEAGARLPTSATELAEALSIAEQEVRNESMSAGDRAAWGRRQQRLYRLLSANRTWVDEVLAEVDPNHASAVATNWEARLALNALLDTSRLSDSLPAWRIEPPAPAAELVGYYHEASERSGVPWEILAAINLIETRMGRINGVSTAGALGPMQFLPTTWAECCEGDPTDDRDAINGAGTYLVDRGALTDLDRAIFGYNNSDHYVRAVRAYAAVMADDPAAYYGFHGWEVYFLSTAGLVSLPVGYDEPEAVKVADWLTANPDRLIDSSQTP